MNKNDPGQLYYTLWAINKFCTGCDVMWCDVTWYVHYGGIMRNETIWRVIEWHDMPWHDTTRYDTIKCAAMWVHNLYKLCKISRCMKIKYQLIKCGWVNLDWIGLRQIAVEGEVWVRVVEWSVKSWRHTHTYGTARYVPLLEYRGQECSRWLGGHWCRWGTAHQWSESPWAAAQPLLPSIPLWRTWISNLLSSRWYHK